MNQKNEMPDEVWLRKPDDSGCGEYSDTKWTPCPFVKNEKKPEETKYIRADKFPNKDGLTQEMINLVIAAREAFETGILDRDIEENLDKALEAFSVLVPYENEPEEEETEFEIGQIFEMSDGKNIEIWDIQLSYIYYSYGPLKSNISIHRMRGLIEEGLVKRVES